MFREKIENQKKLYLYNLNAASPTIEEQLVEQVAQYVFNKESLYSRDDVLAKLIAYLEFDLDYERHQALFTLFLTKEHLSKDELMRQVKSNQMKISLTKRSISQKLLWIKSKHSHTIAMTKAEAVAYIYQCCHLKKPGVYHLKDAVSEYELSIKHTEMRLTNKTKGISYIIHEPIYL